MASENILKGGRERETERKRRRFLVCVKTKKKEEKLYQLTKGGKRLGFSIDKEKSAHTRRILIYK